MTKHIELLQVTATWYPKGYNPCKWMRPDQRTADWIHTDNDLFRTPEDAPVDTYILDSGELTEDVLGLQLWAIQSGQTDELIASYIGFLTYQRDQMGWEDVFTFGSCNVVRLFELAELRRTDPASMVVCYIVVCELDIETSRDYWSGEIDMNYTITFLGCLDLDQAAKALHIAV